MTGALPSTATFPSPSTLSSYQHTGAYPSRSYATNPSLALPDPAFSTSTNGLFPHHDPLLHLKPSQAVLPTALAFNHLSSSTTLGAALPVQSSTYRSAQESAPHLLQPQFSLLPPTLPATHGATQPYGAAVFSGTIERALQRECSVIKHHQRPSASIATSEQLPSSEQPLHGYFSPGGEVDVSYHQDPSRQNAASCGSSTGAAGSSQGTCHAPQPKSDLAVCPPASLPDGKSCPAELAPLPATAEDGHSHPLERASGSPERYPSAGQKQNSVIANQQSAQLSSLMTSSVSQSYITPCSQPATSRAAADRLPPLYKAMTSLSSQPDSVAAATQTLYSSSSGLSHEQELQYSAQAQGLCQGSLSETYSASHPQGPSSVSFTSPSESSTPVSQHHSYTAGQPLNQALDSSYPTTCVHSQPVAQNYALTQASNAGKPHDAPSQLQTQQQKFILAAPLPTYTSTTQALQNNAKPSYGKQKVEEQPLQEMEAQKHASAADSNGMSAHNNVIFVVSKVDEQPKAPSVIRSNSRSDEPFMALAHENVQQFKSERMVPIGQQPFHLSSTNVQDVAADIANSNVSLSPGQLKQQHPLQLKSPELHQPHSQASSANTQFITVPSAQVVLDHNQMILVQQPLVHPGQNSSKAAAAAAAAQGIQPAQDLGSVHVQYLTMDRELLGPSVGVTQSQQGTMVSEPNSVSADSPKLHTYSQSANQQPENTKNHFSLNSICFPDSMLLADDRSILSNVDDILAATVAACGVAPQDFVKAVSTAEAEMAIMASPVDSKAHFQTVDIRHMSPSFSPARHPIMSNTNSHSMTLNGVQMAADCHHHGNNGSRLEAHGNGGSTEDEYCLTGRASYEPSHLQNRIKGNAECVKTEDGFSECQGSDDFPKKKVRSKPQTKGPEEDSRQAKAAKRCGPAKRQSVKGGDAGSPTPPPSTYDGCPQQERIRQKIREVEEKQPEVKTGFIGSFLDFIKSGPKHQYSPGPARTFSRQKKPCSSSRPAPLALPTPPLRVQTLAEPSGPQQHPQQTLGVSAQQKRLEEDLQKNLETLPSFSSDEEENTGKNQALRNSISSALSALDESADRKLKTGRDTLGKCFYHF